MDPREFHLGSTSISVLLKYLILVVFTFKSSLMLVGCLLDKGYQNKMLFFAHWTELRGDRVDSTDIPLVSHVKTTNTRANE